MRNGSIAAFRENVPVIGGELGDIANGGCSYLVVAGDINHARRIDDVGDLGLEGQSGIESDLLKTFQPSLLGLKLAADNSDVNAGIDFRNYGVDVFLEIRVCGVFGRMNVLQLNVELGSGGVNQIQHGGPV